MMITSISGRRGGLVVTLLDSGGNGPGSGPGKTLYSLGASFYPGV